jgi:hypothetical protein
VSRCSSGAALASPPPSHCVMHWLRMGLCHPRGPPLPYLKGNRSCQPPPLFSGANIQFTILASITNRELLGRLGLHTMDTYLARRQLQWLGHVWRMDWPRLPRKLFTVWVPVEEKRVGGRELTWDEGVEKVLKRASHAFPSADDEPSPSALATCYSGSSPEFRCRDPSALNAPKRRKFVSSRRRRSLHPTLVVS